MNFLKLMKAQGNSMAPIIGNGDIVMIDRLSTHIRGNIYAVYVDSTIMLKRLEPLVNGRVRISSDNFIYKEYEAPVSDVKVMGHVIWIAKELL